MTADIGYTHRFVASSDTSRKSARAFLGHALRTRRQWVFYLLVLALFTVVLMSGMDPRLGLGSQITWAAVFALLPTLIVAFSLVAISYVRMVRGSRLRLFEGAVLESGFGEDEMVFRNPIAAVRISFRGIKSLTARGDFVFMQQHGVPVVGIYPRELFPDDAIDRILRATR